MDNIWQNVVRKTHKRTQWTTTKPPTTTMTATNHRIPSPSAKIKKLRGLVAWQMAKTAWQWDYGQSGQHHVWEDQWTQQSVIDQATEDTIPTNRSIAEHNAKLCEMELKWCREKLSLFPSHIHTTFAAVQSHLKARDAKHAQWATLFVNNEETRYNGIEEEGEEEDKEREEWKGRKRGRKGRRRRGNRGRQMDGGCTREHKWHHCDITIHRSFTPTHHHNQLIRQPAHTNEARWPLLATETTQATHHHLTTLV